MVFNEIPGLLQTRAVAKAQLSRSPVVLAADIEGMASAREERGNRLFEAGAPQVWVVLGEEALLRQVGSRDVMAAQLKRLREMADLPTVSIRVIPLDCGTYAGLSCPFTLLWIERAKATIAYLETLTGADYGSPLGRIASRLIRRRTMRCQRQTRSLCLIAASPTCTNAGYRRRA
ncbi:hypothetical protein FDZ84_05145 [Saccharopolyspora sp. ASAGF58]|nr:hypothetical protein FDZ84_05145 [Saccharopolyspora sp. ASAGF58]